MFFVGRPVVGFRTFRELVRIADQKELPILSHEGDGITLYFLIDTSAVYCHSAGNLTAADDMEEAAPVLPAGKSETADAD